MKFEIYPDSKKEYRWRLLSTNGRIIADGSEGYASEYNARRAVESLMCKFISEDTEIHMAERGELGVEFYTWDRQTNEFSIFTGNTY